MSAILAALGLTLIFCGLIVVSLRTVQWALLDYMLMLILSTFPVGVTIVVFRITDATSTVAVFVTGLMFFLFSGVGAQKIIRKRANPSTPQRLSILFLFWAILGSALVWAATALLLFLQTASTNRLSDWFVVCCACSFGVLVSSCAAMRWVVTRWAPPATARAVTSASDYSHRKDR